MPEAHPGGEGGAGSPAPGPSIPPIVAAGASAGGLEACKRLLRAMPSHSGVAWVLIQHLDPHHASRMAELLDRQSRVPVVEARDGMRCQADHAYVIPPGCSLEVREGVLHLSEPAEARTRRTAVDFFFRSLAADRGARAIGVVLSGTGSDGALGLRAIHEAGGLAIAQAPADAEYDGMPRAAIGAGIVDRVLPIEEVPRAVLRYVRHPFFGADAPAEPADQIERILNLVRSRGRFELSGYKLGTLRRRIARRMGLQHIESFEAYAERLESDPQELEALSKDLLIRVTRFFRDPEAFAALAAHVLPVLCERGAAGAPVRVWVPGCSTGEEAWSIAILLFEQLARAGTPHVNVQIFATDVDADALERARSGLFPDSIATDVSPERLRRFFTRDGAHYRVSSPLREAVTFAVQNALGDPPFSRLDLVACRNLLIYLNADAQRRLISLFHFALKPGGFLFLGNAESPGRDTPLFRTVHKMARIYQRTGTQRRLPLDFPEGRMPGRGVVAAPRPRPAPTLRQVAERALLDHLASRAVLVNRSLAVLQFVGRTGPYLEPPDGEPTSDLLSMACPSLRPRLRSVVQRVIHGGAAEATALARDAAGRPLRISARPVRSTGAGDDLFLAVFEPLPEGPKAAPAAPADAPDASQERVIRDLEAELRATREDLTSTIAQLEASNEELKAGTEETMSVNEELQSANEELETSKEELQSLNEELTTVNGQLQEKVAELEALTQDLDNLLASSEIGTLFLDADLRIKRFTPLPRSIMHVRESDVGRSVSELASSLVDPHLVEDAAAVLKLGEAREREVQTSDGRWYLQRLHPYRAGTGAGAGGVEGLVATFYDITSRREAEAARARLAAVVESASEAILSKTLDGIITSWNRFAERMYGYTAEEVIGRSVEVLIPEDRRHELPAIMRTIRAGGTVEPFETVRRTKDGRTLDVLITISPVLGADGRPTGASTIARDITQTKAARRALRRSESRFRMAVESSPVVMFEQDTDLRYTWVANPIFRLGEEEILGRRNRDLFEQAEDVEALDALQRSVLDSGRGRRESVRVHVDGRPRYFDVTLEPLRDEQGRVTGLTGAGVDITELKQAEQSLEVADRRKTAFLGVLGHELRNPLAAVGSAVELLRAERPGGGRAAAARPPEAAEAGSLDWAIGVIDNNASHMSRLLDDLLDVSRIAQGRVRLRKGRMDLRRAVEQAADSTKRLLEERRQELRVDIPADLPALFADATRVEQILLNLLTNASKCTPEEGHIGISAERVGSEVEIRVSDDGRGIASDLLPRVFEPFVQAEDSPDEHGLGIGLALVRQLVRLHGGEAEARSEGIGRGAEIRVRLPIGSGEMSEDPSDRRPDVGSTNGRSVLLVDDNRDIADSLALLLERSGCRVRVAYDGAAALERVREERPDLAVLDLGLPDMSGYELAERIRQLDGTGSIRLVALSGYGLPEEVQRGREAGFDEHLVKPVQARRLLDLIA